MISRQRRTIRSFPGIRLLSWWHFAYSGFIILAIVDIGGFLHESRRPPFTRQQWPLLELGNTNQYACFRHCFSSLTTLTISPPSLFSLSSKADLSTTTYPPRFIHICDRKREGSSTSSGSFPKGSSTEYRLLPSAFLTRAIE